MENAQANHMKGITNKAQSSDDSMLETNRKCRDQYMTQDFYNEETIEPAIHRKKRNLFTRDIPDALIGAIQLTSTCGKRREFHLFKDSALGLGPGCQSIIIDQDWDEDIETDNSCAQKAVKKCIKQLNQAVKHQRVGIDPSQLYTPDYMTQEERYQMQNQMIIGDIGKKSVVQDEYLDEEYLLASRSELSSQMNGMMMNYLECGQICSKQKEREQSDSQCEKIFNDMETEIDPNSQIDAHNNDLNPYYYSKISQNNSQYSQYRFVPDFPSLSSSQY